ncbi:MAG TPA: PAS domain-containing protein [Steroidobacteraceae bacterium]|nr:PAS domain-containing protein [Steroidobacteraceae bacterium]
MKQPAEPQFRSPAHRAFDAMPVAVALVDVDAGKAAIGYVNPAFEQLTQLSQDITGHSPLELVGAQSDPGIVQQWRAALNEHTSFTAELLLCCSHSHSVWVRISMQPFAISDPNAGSLVLTFEDISAHKAARASV